MSALSQYTYGAVRSEGIFAITKWAKNEQELENVVKALGSDVEDDRISAAMALENSSIVSDVLKNALLVKMKDKAELMEVRVFVANSLKRFDLSNSESSEYTNFRKEQMQ